VRLLERVDAKEEAFVRSIWEVFEEEDDDDDDEEKESVEVSGVAYLDFRGEYGGVPINKVVCEEGDRRMLEEG
jgi:hypothetical protein